MRRPLIGIGQLLGTAVLAGLVGPAIVYGESAADIMTTQSTLHRLSDETETLKMTIVNKNGDEKERTVTRSTITGDDGLSKILIRFTAPRDVEGTGMLTWEGEGGQDDQWLYLPAMRKVKRIAASGKKNRFMGTDFAYEDLRPENRSANTYTLVTEEAVDGQDCWVIEAVPASEKYAADTGYSKRKLWVRKDNHVTVKREYYDKRGKLEKVQTEGKIAAVAGTAWRASQIEMQDVQAGTKTLFTSTARTVNGGLGADEFSIDELEEGGE